MGKKNKNKHKTSYSGVGMCPICGCSMPDGECTTVMAMQEQDDQAVALFAEKGFEIDSPAGAMIGWLNIPVYEAQAEAARLRKEREAEEKARKKETPELVGLFSKHTNQKGTSTMVYRKEHALHLFLFALQYMCVPGYPEGGDYSAFKDEEFKQMINSFRTDTEPYDERLLTVSTSFSEGTMFVSVLKRPKSEDKLELKKGHVLSMWVFYVGKIGTLSIRNSYSDNTGVENKEWKFVFP